MSRRSSIWIPFALLAVCTWPTAATVAETRFGEPCTQNPDCDDNNLCTDDTCDPGSGECSFVPNYDLATTCCNPTTGSLSIIECDENHCYEGACFPMSCTCCDLPDGDPCAGPPPPIPATSDWSVAVMALLLMTTGTVLARTRPRGATGAG